MADKHDKPSAGLIPPHGGYRELKSSSETLGWEERSDRLC